MSLYTVDIRIPSAQELFAVLAEPPGSIHGADLLYSDLSGSYFRLEVRTELNTSELEDYFKKANPIALKIRENKEKSFGFIEVTPKRSIKKSLALTSPEVTATLAEEYLGRRSELADFVSAQNRVLLISDGSSFDFPHKALTYLERDSFLIAKYGEFTPIPAWMDTKNEEELIKSIVSLSSGFSFVRLSYMRRNDALAISERLSDLIDRPFIFADYSEQSLVCAAALQNVANFHKVDVKGKQVGIIGLNPCGHGLSEMMFRLGASKVYGIDSDTSQLTRFERTPGIASSMDHLYENADFIIITPGTLLKVDEPSLHKDQFVLSFTPRLIDVTKLKPEVASSVHQGFEPHPVYALPGLVGCMLKAKQRRATADILYAIMKTLATSDGQMLPIPNPDLIRRQFKALD